MALFLKDQEKKNIKMHYVTEQENNKAPGPVGCELDSHSGFNTNLLYNFQHLSASVSPK